MSRLSTKQRRSARWRTFHYYIERVLHHGDNWNHFRREGLTPGEVCRDCKGIPVRELLRHGWKKVVKPDYLGIGRTRYMPPNA